MAQVELAQRGLHLEYESHGDARHPAIILIMGLGLQLVSWPPALIEALVAARQRVIVFDNRDIGLSSPGPLPRYTRPAHALFAHLLHRDFTPPYRLADMAADTLALADALRIERFAVLGVSLGGMIGQTLSAQHPERVRSLISIMSSAGPRTAPWPSIPLLLRFLQPPPKDGAFEARLNHFVRLMQALGHITDPAELETLRARLTRSLRRAYNPAGAARQLLAVMADPDRSAQVATIRCPTLIIHAADDPLVPVAAAHHLARLLPHAQLQILPRMGHYLPAAVLPELTRLCVGHLRGSAQ